MSSFTDEPEFTAGELLSFLVGAMYKYSIDYHKFCCSIASQNDMTALFLYMSISTECYKMERANSNSLSEDLKYLKGEEEFIRQRRKHKSIKLIKFTAIGSLALLFNLAYLFQVEIPNESHQSWATSIEPVKAFKSPSDAKWYLHDIVGC